MQHRGNSQQEHVEALYHKLCTLLNCSSVGAQSSAAAAWPALIGRLAATWPGLATVLKQQQMLIVSNAAKARLQSAVNGHADHSSGPVLLKEIEELLQATQQLWELIISHSIDDAGSRVQCAEQVAESGLLQQLGDACDYMASALNMQQHDGLLEQRQQTGAAAAPSPTTTPSKQTSSKTQTAQVPGKSKGQQMHEQGGNEQQQLLQQSWSCTAAYSLSPLLLSLWESLVQHWPGSWLQSPLAAATLLPAARLAAALISGSNSRTAAAQPLQALSAPGAVQHTAVLSSSSTLNSTSQEGTGDNSSSSQAAAGVDSRTSSNTGPNQQHLLCSLKVSC
jgi:hypothetical protein